MRCWILLPLTLLAFSPTAEAQVDADRLIEIIETSTGNLRSKKMGREVSALIKTRADKATTTRIRLALDNQRVDVAFDGTPTSEAFDFLRDVSGLNIVVSLKARETYGEEEIDLKLKKVKLRNCLELLLDQLGNDLAYGVRHGVLWIGLKTEMKRILVTRIYYIGDILNRPPDFPGPRLGLKGLLNDK